MLALFGMIFKKYHNKKEIPKGYNRRIQLDSLRNKEHRFMLLTKPLDHE